MKSNSDSKLFKRFSGFDRCAGAKLHAHAANHLGFAQTVSGAQLVLGNSIGVQTAGQILDVRRMVADAP